MKKKAFTLVELLVGISISILLMVSVGIFVSSGMKNIALQKEILDENKLLSSNFLEFYKLIDSSIEKIYSTSSGILFRNSPSIAKGTYSYVGVKEFDAVYCSTGETTRANHLFLKYFLPFEEVGEDINNNFAEILHSTGVTVGVVTYKSDIKKHQIINADTDEVIVGKDIFGNTFSEGSVGTGVFLNSPTGVVEAENKLIFSDTLNNRILYLSGGLVYGLLDENDGLSQPTGLAYDSMNKRLYIANSGKGEILELSSKSFGVNPNFKFLFYPEYDFIADRFSVELGTGSINLSGPTLLSSFNFFNIVKNSPEDAIITTQNSIKYYFVSSYQPENLQPLCNAGNTGQKIQNGSDIIQCIASGTGKLANNRSINFSSGNQYGLNSISDITPVLSQNQNYYAKVVFKNGASTVYEKYSQYFTQSDNNIFTRDDNTLEILASGLEYPTGILLSGGDLLINVFETREKKRLNISTGIMNSDGTLTVFSDFSNYSEDIIIKNPVKNLDIDFLGKFMNIKLEYYKYLNCFNPDENIEKTFLLKKSF